MSHTNQSNEYDAIVVGARVAGSIVAARLGDADYRVLLVDRAAFPSPTLSTHFFRGAGVVSVLGELGVLDQVVFRQQRYHDQRNERCLEIYKRTVRLARDLRQQG